MEAPLPDLKLADPTDFEEIMSLFKTVRDGLNQSEIPQWPESYPPADQLLEDLESGSVRVIREGQKIIGTFTLNDTQDKEYESIRWKYNGPFTLVLHRLAVHPDYQGLGLGKALTQQSILLAREASADQLRLDTWSKNRVSSAMYSSLGFERAEGFCYFHGHPEPFYCFEKALKG